MYVLHLDLTIKQAATDLFTATYHDVFCPAIAGQPGFVETCLMAARSSNVRTHRLVIVFEREERQKLWAETELHQEVWRRLQPAVADLSAEWFETV